MLPPSSLLALVLAGVATVSAYDYRIAVGRDEVTGLNGVGFAPSRTVTLGTSDNLIFQLLAGTHRVVRTSFAAPCTASSGFGSTSAATDQEYVTWTDTGLQTIGNSSTAGTSQFTYVVPSGNATLFFADIGGNPNQCLQGAIFCVNTNENGVETCNAFRAAALQLGADQGVPTSIRTNTPIQTSTTTTTPPATSSVRATGAASASSPAPTTAKQGGAGSLRPVSAGIAFVTAGLVWALNLS